MSHGFGGLDKGIRFLVRGENYVSDLAVLNTPAIRTIKVQTEITATDKGYRGPVEIKLARGGKTVATTNVEADVPAGSTATVVREITVPSAELWDIGHPVLYQATARLPKVANSDAQTSFGFRWFTAESIGTECHPAPQWPPHCCPLLDLLGVSGRPTACSPTAKPLRAKSHR